MAEVTMPRLSDTMSEGTVGRWLKQPGDRVESGDIIAEIETDKATMELEAFESGVLQKIIIPEGQTVPIGEVIGMIGAEALEDSGAPEQPASDVAEPAPTEADDQQVAEAQASAASDGDGAAPSPSDVPQQQTGEVGEYQAHPSADGARIKASPLARSMAEQNKIDLGQIQGTGPGGRIIGDNVASFMQQGDTQPAAAAPAQPAAPTEQMPTPAAPASAGDVQPMSRMRRAIARAMTESKPGVPHIYVTVEIDMAAAMELRAQINASSAADVKISVNDMIVKAVAKALAAFPAINSSYAIGEDGQPGIITHQGVHVSVAVATDNGLLAPVIRDADMKSIGTIATEVRELAGRAREGKSKLNDLEGATFQTSNLGMFGVIEFVSIITVPQAASLAIGAVRDVPVVRDGAIVVGQMMNVTLSADHRVADGAVAAQFLQELTRLLQNPLSLLV